MKQFFFWKKYGYQLNLYLHPSCGLYIYITKQHIFKYCMVYETHSTGHKKYFRTFSYCRELFHFKTLELKSQTCTIYLAKIVKLKITLKILLKKEAPIKKWELLRLVFQSVNKLQTKMGRWIWKKWIMKLFVDLFKNNQWTKKTECIQALVRMLLQEKAQLKSIKRY